MKFDTFIRELILDLDESCFKDLKSRVSGKYLHFYVIDHEEISKELFAEKLCDYFVAMHINTKKDYEKNLDIVYSNLISVISSRVIEKTRAEKYMKYIEGKLKKKSLDFSDNVDIMRILLSMYSSIIRNKSKGIENFDTSIARMNIDSLINSLESEELQSLNLGPIKSKTKKRFDSRDKYSTDAFTFLMTLVFYYYLKTNEVSGEE